MDSLAAKLLNFKMPTSLPQLLTELSVDVDTIDFLSKNSRRLSFKPGEIYHFDFDDSALVYIDEGSMLEVSELSESYKIIPLCWTRGFLKLLPAPVLNQVDSVNGSYYQCLIPCTVTMIRGDKVMMALSQSESFLRFWMQMQTMSLEIQRDNMFLRGKMPTQDYIRFAMVASFVYYNAVGYGDEMEITLTELSEVFFCSRQYLTNTLSAMEKEGLLSKYNKGVRLKNLEACIASVDIELLKKVTHLARFKL